VRNLFSKCIRVKSILTTATGHLTLSVMLIAVFGTLSFVLYGLESIFKFLKLVWKLLTLNA
jgi:hypothetical protein